MGKVDKIDQLEDMFNDVLRGFVEAFEKKHDLDYTGFIGDEIGDFLMFDATWYEDPVIVSFFDIRNDLTERKDENVFKDWYRDFRRIITSKGRYVNINYNLFCKSEKKYRRLKEKTNS